MLRGSCMLLCLLRLERSATWRMVALTPLMLAHVPLLILCVVLESDVVGKGWHVFGH